MRLFLVTCLTVVGLVFPAEAHEVFVRDPDDSPDPLREDEAPA